MTDFTNRSRHVGFFDGRQQMRDNAHMHPVLESKLVCPHCGHAQRETMPTDACQFFYECRNCKTVLRPKPGDCCVFCSYGSVKCPPMQRGKCCSKNAESSRRQVI